jgi:predicted small lipoprotein YifL
MLLLAALLLAAPLSACGKRGALVLPPAQTD